MLRFALLLSFASVAAVCGPGAVLAHDPGLSSLQVSFAADSVEARVRADADQLQGLDPDQLVRVEIDGQPLAVRSQSRLVRDGGFAERRLEFAREDTTETKVEVRVVSIALSQLPPDHKQHVRVDLGGDRVLANALLTAAAPVVQIELPVALAAAAGSGSGVARVARFFLLGVEHIATGFDHLLFLGALLIACPGVGAAFRVITAFTLAHSLTLIASGAGFIGLEPSVVEPAIAASVVGAAALNLVGEGAAHRRIGVAFGFGLVHGLGLAGFLSELAVGDGIAPLLGFNLGVEAGQLAFALPVLVALPTLRTLPSFERLGVPVTSCAIAAVGLAWLLQRTQLF